MASRIPVGDRCPQASWNVNSQGVSDGSLPLAIGRLALTLFTSFMGSSSSSAQNYIGRF